MGRATRPVLCLLVCIQSLWCLRKMAPLDLERFRAFSTAVEAMPSTRRLHRTRQARFLKGPIPWNWLEEAARLPGKALHVALEVWRESGCSRAQTVKVSTSALGSLGVSRRAAYAALRRLEVAQLVSVDRHRGRSPIVTILNSGNTPTVSPTVVD